MTGQNTPRLPGRLGHPGMALRDDPRADPQPPLPVDMHSSLEALLAFCNEAETAYEAVNDVFTKVSWSPVWSSATPADGSDRIRSRRG